MSQCTVSAKDAKFYAELVKSAGAGNRFDLGKLAMLASRLYKDQNVPMVAFISKEAMSWQDSTRNDFVQELRNAGGKLWKEFEKSFSSGKSAFADKLPQTEELMKPAIAPVPIIQKKSRIEAVIGILGALESARYHDHSSLNISQASRRGMDGLEEGIAVSATYRSAMTLEWVIEALKSNLGGQTHRGMPTVSMREVKAEWNSFSRYEEKASGGGLIWDAKGISLAAEAQGGQGYYVKTFTLFVQASVDEIRKICKSARPDQVAPELLEKLDEKKPEAAQPAHTNAEFTLHFIKEGMRLGVFKASEVNIRYDTESDRIMNDRYELEVSTPYDSIGSRDGILELAKSMAEKTGGRVINVQDLLLGDVFAFLLETPHENRPTLVVTSQKIIFSAFNSKYEDFREVRKQLEIMKYSEPASSERKQG